MFAIDPSASQRRCRQRRVHANTNIYHPHTECNGKSRRTTFQEPRAERRTNRTPEGRRPHRRQLLLRVANLPRAYHTRLRTEGV